MTVYQLAYISEIAPSFKDKDILDILVISHKKNQENNISGILLYRRGVFFQILEGERIKIDSLYRKIQRDQRHQNIKTLFHQASANAVFPQWMMGQRDLGEQDLSKIDEIMRWKKTRKTSSLNTEQIFALIDLFKR